MRHLIFIFIVAFSLQTRAQTLIGPYYEGQFASDTVFEFTYVAAAFCTEFDVTINTQGLFPFVSGMTLGMVLHAPAEINNVSYSAGTTIQLNQNGQQLSVIFPPTPFSFSIVASGTPSTSSETYPCWFESQHRTDFCVDTMDFVWGESLTPCLVQSFNSINDFSYEPLNFEYSSSSVSFESEVKGTIVVSAVDGREVIRKEAKVGMNSLSISNTVPGTYIVWFLSNKGFWSKKIHIQ